MPYYNNSRRAREPSLMPRRIRRRKAVPRDLPGAVIVSLEDKQLLVALRAFRSGRMVRGRPGGIRACEGPTGTKLDDFSNCEFYVQGDGLENRVVRLPDGRRTNRRLTIRRHEYAVFRVERHNGIRARCIQSLVILCKQGRNTLCRRAHIDQPRFRKDYYKVHGAPETSQAK